jgi:imidazolonepropionase
MSLGSNSTKLLRNCRIATMTVSGQDVIGDGAILLRGDRIDYAGSRAGLPEGSFDEEIDLGGRLVTPGLIDCHTHLVHGGHRAREFEMRLEGASYVEIAQQEEVSSPPYARRAP